MRSKSALLAFVACVCVGFGAGATTASASTIGPGGIVDRGAVDSAADLTLYDTVDRATGWGHLGQVDFYSRQAGATVTFFLVDATAGDEAGVGNVTWIGDPVVTTLGANTYTPAVPPVVRKDYKLGVSMVDSGVIPWDDVPGHIVRSNFPSTAGIPAVGSVAFTQPVLPDYSEFGRVYSFGGTVVDDTVKPTVAITSTPADPTVSTAASFTWTASDDVSPASALTFTCKLDAAAAVPCTSPADVGPVSANASHTLTVTASDEAGNTESDSYTWYVDHGAPTTTLDNPKPANPTNVPSATFTFTGADDQPGPVTFECSLDGAVYSVCTDPQTYPVLGAGSHTFSVRAVDGLGNTDASPATYTWFVDTTPPNTSILTKPADPTASTVANFTFTGTDNHSSPGNLTFECRRDGGPWSSCTSPDNGTAAEGHRTFDVRAIDEAGNTDASPASWAWLVDLADPTVTVISPAARTQDPYTPGDPRQIVRPFYPLHGGPPSYTCADPLAGSPAGASGIASCIDNFDNETLGAHEFDVRATDNVGHVTHSKDVTPRAYRIVPPKYDDFVKADGPTAYFRLDDPLGATVGGMADSSGHGFTGTHQNGVVLRRPPALKCEDWKNPHHHPDSWCDPYNYKNQGYSAFYDGSADHSYVNNVPQAGSWDENGQHITETFSADAWGYPVGDGHGNALSTLGLMSHGQEFEVWYDGRWHARLVNGTELVGPAQSADRWYHVGVTWNGSTVRLYVNGVQVDSRGGVTNAWSGHGNKDTLFVGRTNISASTWWHGYIDEVAYFNNKVLSQHDMHDRWKIGASDEPGGAGGGVLDMTRPTIDTDEPAANATYNANAKTLPNPPHATWSCDDPDGAFTITSCTATVDGNPITAGDPLPLTGGTHDFRVYATNVNGLFYEHHHTYVVKPFDQIVLGDGPEAYYRLNEPSDAHTADDATGNHPGEYKNDTKNGPTGISGDGNTTRSFLGKGGYVSVNGVPAGNLGYSVEAWVKPDDHGDMAIFDHGAGGSGPALFLRDGRVVLHLPDGGPDPFGSRELVSGAFPYDGEFHQVAATWDGVTAKLFLDGQVVDARETTRPPSGTSTLYVGFGNVGLWQPWFRGAIDEVSYYRTALTDQRIREHWQADPPAGVSPATEPVAGAGGPGVTSSAEAPTAVPLSKPAAAVPSVVTVKRTASAAAKKAAAKKAAAKKAAAKKAAAKRAAARKAAAKRAAAKRAAAKKAAAKRIAARKAAAKRAAARRAAARRG